MKSIAFIFMCLFLTAASCKKENSSNGKWSTSGTSSFRSELSNSRTDSYDQFLEDTHGVISFKASHEYYQSYITWNCYAIFCQNLWASFTFDNRTYENVGDVKINNLQLPRETRNGYMIRDASDDQANILSGFFGHTVTFSMEGSGTSGYSSLQTSLYIPKYLNVEFTDDGQTINSRPVITRNSGLMMHWATDENNTKGVLIKVENQNEVNDQGQPDMSKLYHYATNYILVDDDG